MTFRKKTKKSPEGNDPKGLHIPAEECPTISLKAPGSLITAKPWFVFVVLPVEFRISRRGANREIMR